MICEGSLNNYRNVCNSCTTYILLFIIFSISSLTISNVFVYFYWHLKSDISITNINPGPLNIQMGNIKQINIKNGRYYFLMTWIILKTLTQTY